VPEQEVDLRSEIEKLRAVAADGDDARLSAILVAVTDERVQETLTKRLAEGHRYVGAVTVFEAGKVDVIFSFTRAPGRFGLAPVSILATVSPTDQRVLRLVENHRGGDEMAVRSLGARQPNLDLGIFMTDRQRLPDELAGYANGPTSYWV
jgi:tRNA nucleotidyltransferase/poly(A) polymerase